MHEAALLHLNSYPHGWYPALIFLSMDVSSGKNEVSNVIYPLNLRTSQRYNLMEITHNTFLEEEKTKFQEG